MKTKFKYILILLGVTLPISHTYSMDMFGDFFSGLQEGAKVLGEVAKVVTENPALVELGTDAMKGMADITRDIGKGIDQSFTDARNFNENQAAMYKRQAAEARREGNEVLARRYEELFMQIEQRKIKQDSEGAAIQSKLANGLVDLPGQMKAMAEKRMEAYELNQRELNNAVQNRKKGVEQVQVIMNAVKDPETLKRLGYTVSGVALAIFAARYGAEFAFKQLGAYIEGKPSLAQETSLISLREKLMNRFVWGTPKIASKVSDVIFEPVLAQRMATLAEGIINTAKNGGYFRNIMLHGPPGTGKTMVAQRIARSAGLDYIYFAASSFDQMSTQEATRKWNELMQFANSGHGLVVIIDECEELFKDRENDKVSEHKRTILNFFLTFTGTESNRYMVIALTNRPQVLDDAILSRFPVQIQVGAPGVEERKRILKSYVKKYLIQGAVVEKKQQWSLANAYARWFGTPKKTKITVDADVLNEAYLDSIATRLEGFVGRDISNMVISWQSEAYATKDARLTKAIVEREVGYMIANKDRQKIQKAEKTSQKQKTE